MPLFAEDLGDTLGRGADPESGHALELAAARFRPGAAALAAEGDWCYKDGRAPIGGGPGPRSNPPKTQALPSFLSAWCSKDGCIAPVGDQGNSSA